VSDRRLILLGAGGPAGFNFVCALRGTYLMQGLQLVLVDSNALHLELCRDHAAWMPERNPPTLRHVMPAVDWEHLAANTWGRDALVHAQPDVLVEQLSAARDRPVDGVRAGVTFMPGPRTIAMCQDKFATAHAWRAHHLVEHEPQLVSFRADLAAAERDIGYPMWIRARRGAGARHASFADSRDVAGTWINYLVHRFGAEDLVVQGYLPGRDYAVTLLYWRGAVQGVLTRERLEYLYPQHAVSGRTGTPVVAALVRNERVEAAAELAVRAVSEAVGEAPHGVYCVDLREDAHGLPRPTEINAGRFFTTSHVGVGVHVNLVERYCELHFDGGPSKPPLLLPADMDGTLVLRHMDAETQWLHPWSQTPAHRDAVARLREQTMQSSGRS